MRQYSIDIAAKEGLVVHSRCTSPEDRYTEERIQG
jgi:hypothetical protein